MLNEAKTKEKEREKTHLPTQIMHAGMTSALNVDVNVFSTHKKTLCFSVRTAEALVPCIRSGAGCQHRKKYENFAFSGNKLQCVIPLCLGGLWIYCCLDGGREKQDASDKTHQISDCRNELAAINVLALFHSSACGKFFLCVFYCRKRIICLAHYNWTHNLLGCQVSGSLQPAINSRPKPYCRNKLMRTKPKILCWDLNIHATFYHA